MASLVALLVVSIAVHRDNPPRAEMCVAYQALQSSAQSLVTIAAETDASATRLRDTTDQVLADLTALESATDDQFDVQIDELTRRMADLRVSLSDVDGNTRSDSARALIDEALDELRPAAAELVQSIEPICTTDDQ